MDLAETVYLVEEEAARLPQLLSDLWELFSGLKGTTDATARRTLVGTVGGVRR